jgi:hypothetical protein
MDAASIDKLEIIENSFIQKDCKAPFLTSNTGTNLPVVLASFTNFGRSYNDPTTTAVYYKASGEKENPKFISNNAIVVPNPIPNPVKKTMRMSRHQNQRNILLKNHHPKNQRVPKNHHPKNQNLSLNPKNQVKMKITTMKMTKTMKKKR